MSKRYSTAVESSPISERLAARARAHSSSSAGSPALREALGRLEATADTTQALTVWEQDAGVTVAPRDAAF